VEGGPSDNRDTAGVVRLASEVGEKIVFLELSADFDDDGLGGNVNGAHGHGREPIGELSKPKKGEKQNY